MTDYDSQDGRDVPSSDGMTAAQEQSDHDDVSAAMLGLAGLVSDVVNVELVLGRIAEFALAATPGADGVGVTVVRKSSAPPAVRTWAVTAPFVREIDHLQYEICHEGPCLTAMETRRPLTSGSLGSDGRWRRFGGRVARLNVHSALSLPLISRDEVVGALNIYARERDAFTDHAVALAARFATPAGVSVGNLQLLHAAHERAEQLHTALKSRAVIDQAIGIVRSRSGATEQEAFDRLRQLSQADGIRMAVVAQRIVDDAVRRARARASSQRN